MTDMQLLDVQVPEEWPLTRPVDMKVMAVEDVPEGPAAFVGWLFADGMNLMAVVWPGGQRIARIAQETGWALEERFEGEQPTDEDDVRLQWWRDGIAGLAFAVAETRRELGL